MKYTIAIAALLGNTNALAAYEAAKQTDQSTGNETTGAINTVCQQAMRGQKTAVWHFNSKYLYKTAASGTTIDSVKATETLCKTEAPVDTKCTTANTAAARTVPFSYIKSILALNGNRVNGVHACPQTAAQCPGDRIRVLAEGKGATVAEVKMNLVAVIEGGCSYLIEAQCDAPYVAIKTSADYTAAQYTGTTFSVVEYDSSFEDGAAVTSRKFYTAADTTARLFVPATAIASWTSGYTNAQLQKIPNNDATFSDNANAGKGQGQGPSLRKLAWFKGAAHTAWTASNKFDLEAINTLWAAKSAEYTAYAATKAAYETKKTDYNTKLDAAEKLVKEKLDKDIFRKLSPTEDDKKVLNAVPARPSNPSLPAAYAGPAIGAKSTEYKQDTFWVLPVEQETIVTGANALHLGTGKSFGTAGSGTTTQTVAVAGDSLKADALGQIFSAKDNAATPACRSHYMMFQAGYVSHDTTALGAAVYQHMQYGSKAAAMSFEKLTMPTQAADPKVPSTGASMLAAGAASLAVAMTLF